MYENLKIGDRDYAVGGGPIAEKHIETVERITKTLIVTNEGKYLKTTGFMYGYSDQWWPPRLKGKVG